MLVCLIAKKPLRNLRVISKRLLNGFVKKVYQLLLKNQVESPLKGIKLMITDPASSLDDAEKWGRLFDDTVIKKAGAR